MSSMKRVVVMFLGVFALMVMAAGTNVAYADEILCTGTIGARTVDDVFVPSGKTCTLNGTRVEGNVKVASRATLYVKGGARIDGNIQADSGARLVSLAAGSFVDGDIQVKKSGAVTVLSSRVNGNIQLEENKQALKVNKNTVGGDIQIFKNTGGATINGNVVDGNLQCKENSPAPKGKGNIVDGNKEDQCRRF